VFVDSCADGLQVYNNADVDIHDCFFTDMFRSSISITGGYSKIRINNCRGNGDTHVSAHQLEVDAAGYGSSYDVDVVVTNSQFKGGFDVGFQAGDVRYENCQFGPGFMTNNYGVGRLTAVNCDFYIDSVNSRIYRYGFTKFVSCTFTYNVALTAYSFIQSGGFTGQEVVFDSCRFAVSGLHTAAAVSVSAATRSATVLTVDFAAAHGLVAGNFVTLAGFSPTVYNGVWYVASAPSTTQILIRTSMDFGAITLTSATGALRSVTAAIGVSASDNDDNNKVVLRNSSISAGFNYAYAQAQGGSVLLQNNSIESAMVMQLVTGTTQGFTATVSNNALHSSVKMYAFVNANIDNGNKLSHSAQLVSEQNGGIITTSNLTYLTHYGARLIYGAAAPTASVSAGFMGDEWRLNTPVASSNYSWISSTNAITGVANAWKLLDALGP
jgi:hypothetical protein